jgi:hypothetical protein
MRPFFVEGVMSAVPALPVHRGRALSLDLLQKSPNSSTSGQPFGGPDGALREARPAPGAVHDRPRPPATRRRAGGPRTVPARTLVTESLSVSFA